MFSQSSTPFGSPQGGFGQTNTAPAFGSPAPAPFGAPASASFGGFGAPAPAPSAFGGFGAPAPAPSGFGSAFGAPAPAPSAFGTSSGFGSSATSSPFGAPAPAPTGLFGAAPAPSGGLFGSAPAPSSGFGSTTSSGFGGFGTSSTTPAFGTSTFGAPAPSTGLFGAPAPAPSGFGSSGFGLTTSTFGSPAPAPSSGLFGAAPAPAGGFFGTPAPSTGSGGTKLQPYQATSRQDGQSTITLHSITAMPAYESKSFEELRFEDYSQGNRGAGTPNAGVGFGGFGSPAPATGLFGAAPTPAFGAPAPAPGGFGSSFGAPTSGPFGAPAPAAFGAPAPAPFGAPTTTGFGSFGAKPPASGGLFGAPAPAPGGLFGSTPAPAPPGGLFGSAAPPPVFGSPAPAPGGLFGSSTAPAPSGGLFGSTPAPAPSAFGSTFGGSTFGAPAPAPGGLFGSPAPAPAFGAPASGSLFGAPAPAPGSFFGVPAPSPGGLFGAPAPAPGSFFGAPPPAPPPAFGAPAPTPSLFGPPAPPAQMPAAPPVGAVMPPAANEILTAQLTALENKRKEIEKSDNFRRNPGESSVVNAVTLSENDALRALTPSRTAYPSYRASPKSAFRATPIRPRGFVSPDKTTTPSLSRLGSGGKPMAAPDGSVAMSATRLVINPSPKPKLKLVLDNDKKDASPLKITAAMSPPVANGIPPVLAGREAQRTTPSPSIQDRSSLHTPQSAENGYDYYQKVINSPDEAAGTAIPAAKGVVPTLSKAGYKCTPPIEVLQELSSEDLAAIPAFSVERPGVGKVEWEGAVDVRGADLDSIVIIEPASASVYMQQEEEGTKPPVGTKLNRSAVITLEGVLPPQDNPNAQEKFARKVARQTTKMGAELISYDPVIGEWKLKVQHFSRYALTDDDSDSDPEADFRLGEREGRSPRVVGRGILKKREETQNKLVQVHVNEEEETALVSDIEMTDESKILQEAEAALTNMQLTLKVQMTSSSKSLDDEAPFPEEFETKLMSTQASRYIPSVEDFEAASSMPGICRKLANQAGIISSSTDFGIRMGRSFRVGWSPDGTFFSLKAGGILVRRRPTFTEECSSSMLTYLQKHQSNAVIGRLEGGCPFFSLPSGGEVLTALTSYTAGSDESSRKRVADCSIARQSFSLLKCLIEGYNGNQNDQLIVAGDKTRDTRRVTAVKHWFIDSCSDEVDCELDAARERNENHGAILAAVSGGDLDKVCSVAEELGQFQLATMVSAGPNVRNDILNEVMGWTDKGVSSSIPDDLLRSYFLVGGDLTMEDDIYRRKYSHFDWRRRLAMRLAYDSSCSQCSLSAIVGEYENSISRGAVPYPQPQYLDGTSREHIQCVLYRLLRLGECDLKISLREVIDPVGHTRSVHDFSLSFHLAALISAVGCSSPLTDVEEQSLLDGYVAQLVSEGSWEWGVYVALCSFDASSEVYPTWKMARAKRLVLQNFDDTGSNQLKRRNFLERLGVPSKWFEEALALRCFTNGDAYSYLNHMMNVSTEEASTTLEYIFIPNLLFVNKDKLSISLNLLDVLNDSSLANATLDFFQVYQNIIRLEGASRAEIDGAVPELVATCEDIEKVFAAFRSSEENLNGGPALRLVPDTKLVPMASFLAEALSQLSLFKLQLTALKSGLSISSTASQILNLSKPQEFMESGISARENILRWLM